MIVGFEVIVVGAGLWGSACARHLAQMGVRVALIGPAEPDNVATHAGVFSSHYDAARITRRLDGSQDWSRFASASMARYQEIEAASGETFFHQTGYLLAAPTDAVVGKTLAKNAMVAERDGIECSRLDEAGLRAQFPYLAFPNGVSGIFEPGGGWINPRSHVSAEIALAETQGVTLTRTEVTTIDETNDGVLVHCADGQQIAGHKVVVACGGFSKADGLLPKPLPLKVFARTLAFLEIDAAEAERLKNMPSIVYYFPDGGDCYVLPPVVYPDGKIYLKIGGDPDDQELTDEGLIKDWFQSGGNPAVGKQLAEILEGMLPGLRHSGITYGSCVTAFTPRGSPLIYAQSDHIFAVAGGNGAGAKCADEIGRLGALTAMGESLPEGRYLTDFKP